MTSIGAHAGMSAFEDFQQSEYQHIANAHFKAIESISSFFRYYLLVVGLPISVVAAILGLSSQGQGQTALAPAILYFASTLCIAVAVAGFCVLIQIINLKMDAA